MKQKLIVEDSVVIKATPNKIWEVLTKPKYVSQWDELPEDYPTDDMTEGSEVVWELPNGGKSITTIIKAIEFKELKIALNVTTWEIKPPFGEISYHYQLEEIGDQTELKIVIGDFSLIKDGQMYYDASVEFASKSKQTIKELAEGLHS